MCVLCAFIYINMRALCAADPPTSLHADSRTERILEIYIYAVHLGLARTIYIRCIFFFVWQRNHQIYGHMRCI